MRLTLLIAAILTLALTGRAQSADAGAPLRPVSAAYTVEAGSAHLCDTYLSPLKYSGWSTALSYRRRQTTPFDARWQYRLDGRLTVDRAGAPRGSSVMWGAQLELQWGMARSWQLPYGVTLRAGAALGADAGCLYNGSNGNNPASAKAALTLNAIGEAAWRTHIGRLPVTLSWQPSMPVIGAFFSPEYDELYYEIYLGNRHGLAHCAWWGNRFALNNLVAIDLHLSNTALRLGFDSSVLSSEVNRINTEIIRWRFVIGVSGNWISVR